MKPAVFDASFLELLRKILREAWEAAPKTYRIDKPEVAIRLLKRAANGERDPERLRAATTADVLDSSVPMN